MTRVLAKTRTSDGVAVTGKGVLRGALLCGGSDAATVTIYDSGAASGSILGKLGVAAGVHGEPLTVPGDGVPFETGIYLDFTGTSPTGTVYYTLQ